MRKFKAILFAGMVATSTFLSACGGGQETDEEVVKEVEADKLEIYTTLFPLEDFTNKIGGEFVNVTNLIPTGADAHTYEPTAREMISVAESDMFIYNGAGIDGFANAIIDTVTKEDVLVVRATEGIELIAYDQDHNDKHDEDGHGHEEEVDVHGHEEEAHDHGDEEEKNDHGHEEEEHGHIHGDGDPHVWLDPVLSIQLAQNIKEALTQLMPEHQDVFEANFSEVKQELEAIDAEFTAMVDEVEKDTFIISHAGFGYWENRYGIHQIGITGLSPTNEPTRQQLEQIIKFAKEYNIQHVAFEQNFASNIADVVKDEVGADPVYIHNLEVLVQENIDNNDDYFSLMRKNIEALRIALQ